MATSVKTIEAALKLVDSKKESLKKAYDDLSQCHPSLSQSLSWSDIDSHFASIQNSLNHRFDLLQTLELTQPQQDNPSSSAAEPHLVDVDGASSSQRKITSSQERVNSVSTRSDLGVSKIDPLSSQLSEQANSVASEQPCQGRADSVVSTTTYKQELIAFCKKSDVEGLLKYISKPLIDRDIQAELPEALRAAPDPAAMVLDVMPGFLKRRSNKVGNLRGSKLSYVLLLEVLIEIGANVSDDAKERAKKLALEAKADFQFTTTKNSWEALGFLHLLVAYKLENVFEKGELVDFFLVAPKFMGLVQLCRSIDLGDKIHDLVEKLIARRKLMLAVKFICGLGLSHTHPPAPLLKAYLDAHSAKRDNLASGTVNKNEAIREIEAYKAVINTVEECKIESDYPLESLRKHVEQLEKEKANLLQPKEPKKEPKQKQKQQQPKEPKKEPKQKQQQPSQQQSKKRKIQKQQPKPQTGNKRVNTTAAYAGPRAAPVFQQPNLQPAGLYSEHSALQHLNLPGGHGFVGGAASIPNAGYVTAASGLYSEQYVPSAYHVYGENDSVSQYQYHPSYYPQ